MPKSPKSLKILKKDSKSPRKSPPVRKSTSKKKLKNHLLKNHLQKSPPKNYLKNKNY